VLVQKGTLRPGQIVVAGDQWGRVRALINDKGEHVKEATPATPVEVLGLSGTPAAGDKFAVVESESRAREISEYRQRLARDKAAARQSGQRGSLEQMMTQLQTVGVKEFPLVIKGDVQARSKPLPARSTSSAPTKSAPASSIRAQAASRNRMFRSPKPRMQPSSASTFVPMHRLVSSQSAKASRSATTTSSTTWWMT
jgi:hypothetical protein